MLNHVYQYADAKVLRTILNMVRFDDRYGTQERTESGIDSIKINNVNDMYFILKKYILNKYMTGSSITLSSSTSSAKVTNGVNFRTLNDLKHNDESLKAGTLRIYLDRSQEMEFIPT